MRRRAVIFWGSLIAVAIAVYLVIAAWTPIRLTVAVAFTGYQNDPAGERMAIFKITNHSHVPIRRWDRYDIEVPEQKGPRPVFFRGQNVVLEAGQSETWTIPVPTGPEPWRVVLHCSEFGKRQKLTDWIGRSGYWQYLPKSLQAMPGQYIQSDWVRE